jgi:hypothetical protein
MSENWPVNQQKIKLLNLFFLDLRGGQYNPVGGIMVVPT